ncbi:Protein fam72a [Quaeritorhiza haematococci]|nr:Protein fam72a [Quaeritorhiza haematococci]
MLQPPHNAVPNFVAPPTATTRPLSTSTTSTSQISQPSSQQRTHQQQQQRTHQLSRHQQSTTQDSHEWNQPSSFHPHQDQRFIQQAVAVAAALSRAHHVDELVAAITRVQQQSHSTRSTTERDQGNPSISSLSGVTLSDSSSSLANRRRQTITAAPPRLARLMSEHTTRSRDGHASSLSTTRGGGAGGSGGTGTGVAGSSINPSIHPQFRSKAVCTLQCSHCGAELCKRGMKAILLGNTKVELFSTDMPPRGVQLVFDDYTTQNCACRIKDAACLGCGNVDENYFAGQHFPAPKKIVTKRRNYASTN